MPKPDTTWGIVATIKAPTQDTLKFAAHHLELGAHRVHIYLDAPDELAFAHLKAHPKVRVTTCDDAYWIKWGKERPDMHQPRQSLNATRTYRRNPQVDWLAHIDVDEFLWPAQPLDQILAAVTPETLCLRARPREQLAGPGDWFKGFIPPGPDRSRLISDLFPLYGRFVKGGFLSHVAGKVIVRTGLDKIGIRIHNAFQGGKTQVPSADLTDVPLLHCHAKDWEDWRRSLAFRRSKGAYRASLAPNIARDKGGLSMHELLAEIEDQEGEAGLRAFYDELNAISPEGRQRLADQDLLYQCPLDLDRKLRKQFPDFG
ncbi:glycosyltransferase family 2 protein [Falsiruegeria mediterranea]|uniref:Glycosyl transferase family 2 n=1 Tax=Falsiruegeria mediterranea M17 TaxID=1200281 RepID=A0A2R8C4C7_9RHOB|nr:glycosyltransferase family 2 protein [Falsiruegeria mediterranea]SPJ27280.1 hypothetical protein TRM7615_00764 [Falsiruegeria mediterranea M17]